MPPNFAELKIVETDPGLRGDTSSGGGKPATLETGAVVRVPLFVNEGKSSKWTPGPVNMFPGLRAYRPLIHPRYLVAVRPQGMVLEKYSIAIEQGLIVSIMTRTESEQAYPEAESIELPDHVLLTRLYQYAHPFTHDTPAGLCGRHGSGCLAQGAHLAGGTRVCGPFIRCRWSQAGNCRNVPGRNDLFQ